MGVLLCYIRNHSYPDLRQTKIKYYWSWKLSNVLTQYLSAFDTELLQTNFEFISVAVKQNFLNIFFGSEQNSVVSVLTVFWPHDLWS